MRDSTPPTPKGMRKSASRPRDWKRCRPQVTKGADGEPDGFRCEDPEGNKVQFVQPPANSKVDAPSAIGHHIIHVGFLVHDRGRKTRSIRDLLGLRPYWWGGMTDAKVDWVSQQVPDGHDWLEYMLASGPEDRDSCHHVSAYSGRARSHRYRRRIRWMRRTRP